MVKLRSECVAIIAICSLKVPINESPYNARHAYFETHNPLSKPVSPDSPLLEKIATNSAAKIRKFWKILSVFVTTTKGRGGERC